VSGFTVDVAALDGMARGLRDSADRLRSVSRRLDGADARQLGGRELDSACGTFAGEWKYGLGQLSELAGGIAERVEGAVRVYRENDEAVRAAMAGGE
jgi:hypothetical protein